MGLFDGLGLGLAQIGAGVSRGELAATANQERLAQAKALQDYRNLALTSRTSDQSQALDIRRQGLQQRAVAPYVRALADPDQTNFFARNPSVHAHYLSIVQGHMPPEHGVGYDPTSGTLSVGGKTYGADTTPDGAAAPAETAAPNQPADYLPGETNKQHEARIRTGQQGQAVSDKGQFYGALGTHFQNQDVIAGTKTNADLANQQFDRELKLAQAKLQAGHTTFQEQDQVWSRLLSMAGQAARAGGNPGAVLKPFLFNHGAMGMTTPNEVAIKGYLSANGFSPSEISAVISGTNAGGGAQFSGGQPRQPAAPDTAVRGSFQTEGGPPVLPQVGSTEAASLPGGGPPSPSQVAGSNAAVGSTPAAPGRPDLGATTTNLGVNTPGTAPGVKSPFQAGTFEDEIFGIYTGRHGRAVPAQQIIDQFRGNPQLQKSAARVLDAANAQQREGLFAGMPVQGTNGAEWPNVPDLTGGQVHVPGASIFGNPGTTPVTLQGGFGPGTARPPGAMLRPAPAGPGAVPPMVAGAPATQGGPAPILATPPAFPMELLPPDFRQGSTQHGPTTPPTSYIDLGPWNAGSDSGGGGFVAQPGSVPGPYVPEQHAGQGPKGKPGYRLGQEDTRLSKTIQGLMDQRGPNMLAGPPGGTPGAVEPGPGPTVSAVGLPEVTKNIQAELKQYRALPYSPAVEKLFKSRGITDPAQQQSIYRWTTAEVLPRLRDQHPELGEKGIRANLYGVLNKYLPK